MKNPEQKLSLLQAMHKHKDPNNDSICIELVDFNDAQNKDAKPLNIFFDTEENLIVFSGLEFNNFINLLPLQFKELKVIYYVSSDMFFLYCHCFLIVFISRNHDASSFLNDYFIKQGITIEQHNDTPEENIKYLN